MAKAPRSKKAPSKSPAEDSDFILHSLQDALEKERRYDASKEQLLHFYEQMLLIRRFEERAGQLYGLGLIGGFCHLYIGQEAVAIGLQSALDGDKDSVITGYRDHGHMLAYGIDPKVIMAELTGREAGISKGKGGSMHMFSTEHKFYGGHGIVGAQVALGGGLALAGAVFQALLRNPLAEPYILGISGGAATGAVLALAFGLAVSHSWALPIAAFVGALLAITLVLNVAAAAEFRAWVDTCIFVLLATGVILTFNRLTPGVIGVPYAATLGVKIALSIWMFVLARGRRRRNALLDAHRAQPRPPASVLQRAARAFSGYNAIVILGIIVFLLADALKLIYEQALAGS